MEIILLVIVLVISKFVFDINISDIKNLKEIGYDKNLKEIADKLPKNKEICEEILGKYGKNDVKIKEEKDTKTSLYIVATNSILIADISDTFTRIQTIIHECMHSMQNKKMLVFNFIYSNIYLLYYIVSIILILTGVFKDTGIQLIILTILSFVYYAIRSYLETDAMTRAEYITKDYIDEKQVLNKEEKELLKSSFDKINVKGTSLVNFQLLASVMIKLIIYAIIMKVI